MMSYPILATCNSSADCYFGSVSDPHDHENNTNIHSLTAKFLLALASTVILGYESRGTYYYILLSDGSGSLPQISSLNPCLCQNMNTQDETHVPSGDTTTSLRRQAEVTCNKKTKSQSLLVEQIASQYKKNCALLIGHS
jgi:hypothetical protein